MLWLPLPACCLVGDGRNTVSESTVSNTELSELIGPHCVPEREIELSEFLSAYYLCAKAKSPSMSQNSPSLLENSVSSLFQNSTLETVFRSLPIVDWSHSDIAELCCDFHFKLVALWIAGLTATWRSWVHQVSRSLCDCADGGVLTEREISQRVLGPGGRRPTPIHVGTLETTLVSFRVCWVSAKMRFVWAILYGMLYVIPCLVDVSLFLVWARDSEHLFGVRFIYKNATWFCVLGAVPGAGSSLNSRCSSPLGRLPRS